VTAREIAEAPEHVKVPEGEEMRRGEMAEHVCREDRRDPAWELRERIAQMAPRPPITVERTPERVLLPWEETVYDGMQDAVDRACKRQAKGTISDLEG
jgi:hypothetical protein